MRRISLVAVLLLVGLVGPGDAGPPECTCRSGKACWHWLRSPELPPDDPCSCARCEEVRRHDGSEAWPEDWSRAGFPDRTTRRDAFLRRHAASWGLVCSVCDTVRLPGIPEPELYPFRPGGRRWSERAFEKIRHQVDVEEKLLGTKPVVVQTPHFYLVSDVPWMKVPVKRGRQVRTREFEAHELAHLYAERLEKAYDEFVAAFGPPRLKRPVGVFLIESSVAASVLQEAYLGHPDTTILIGGSARTISEGHCMCGFCVALHRQKHPGYPTNRMTFARGRKTAKASHWLALRLSDDDQAHLRLRHLAGHTLMAAWPIVRVQAEHLRPWLYVGVAHWLARRHHRLGELATFCGEECEPLRDRGRKWDERARKIASDPRRMPLEELFAIDTIPDINDLDLHVRAWSLFEVYLEHDRERFAAFLRALREGADPRATCQRVFDLTPEQLDRRWASLVLRGRLEREPAAGAKESPDAAALRKIRDAAEPRRRAALVRALGVPSTPSALDLLFRLLGDRSPHVRETVVRALSRVKDPALRARVVAEVGGGRDGVALAGLIRVVGRLGDGAAAPAVRERLGHGHWLVRANACRALADLGDEAGAAAVLARLRVESSPKVKIAAYAALARLRGDVGAAVRAVSTSLGDRLWPVRVAAARALGALGSREAVDDLIAAMEAASGRTREECHDALRRITRDDLGRDPAHWRRWWEKEKGRDRPEAPPPPTGEAGDRPTEAREPTYYGIRVFSERIGYVLDVSRSMTTLFRPTADVQRRLRRSGEPRPRLEFARNELIASIRGLDPRAALNIWTFHDTVHSWKKGLVPANGSGKTRAISHVRGLTVGEATNYYDVLREVLGLPESGYPAEGFRPTPDTLFFLTDGEPTVGEITDREELLAWFLEENRFAGLRCHVIAFGDKNLDFRLLSALAEETGGSFVHLKED
jgi:HEAT repeat protein